MINFSVGDHVILDSKIRDEATTAKNKYGGWSSQFVRDQSQLININRDLDIEKALLIEPLSCAYGAIRKSNVKSKDNILILGANNRKIENPRQSLDKESIERDDFFDRIKKSPIAEEKELLKYRQICQLWTDF